MSSFFKTQLRCCLGPDTCSFCCSRLPPIKQSTSTKLMYSLILLFASVLFYLNRSLHFQKFFLSSVERYNFTCVNPDPEFGCKSLFTDIFIYKTVFVLEIFHLSLMILTIKIVNSNNCRGDVHNGFWLWKVMILACLSFLTYKIHFTITFITVWMYIAIIAGALFLVIQLLFLIYEGQLLQDKWAERVSTNEVFWGKVWLVALYLFNGMLISIITCSIVLMFLFYTTHDSCYENKVILTIGASMCLVMCLSTICKPPSQRKAVALLGGLFVSLYFLYVTLRAIAFAPPTQDHSNSTFLITKLFAPVDKKKDFYLTCSPNFPSSGNGSKWYHVVGDIVKTAYNLISTILMTVVALASSLNMSSRAHLMGVNTNSHVLQVYCHCCPRREPRDSNKRWGQMVEFNDRTKVSYSYSFFHFLFMLTYFYIMLQLTNWINPGLQLSQNKQEWFPVFVKILTTWFCFVLFMLYILAPGLLLKASAKLITRKASEQERGEREEEELRTYSITES